MSSLYQMWRFENVLEPGQLANGYDRLYVPQVAYTTGDIDVHDVAVDGSGRVIFVNTLFGCLATVSETHSFVPLWKPPFLSKLAAEDRCHLNGLAMQDGRPKYVTTVSQSDVADGWRDRRRNGGCVIDVTTNETIITGLSMPHSPRVHQAAENSPFGNRIHFTGWVDDSELLQLYNACDIFTFPSFYEGFGIPILEAMACGRAVACSRTSAMPEVAGKSAVLFDPHSIEGMMAAMRDLLRNTEMRARMERAGVQNASRFTWRGTAQMTLDVYHEVAGARKSAGQRTASAERR